MRRLVRYLALLAAVLLAVLLVSWWFYGFVLVEKVLTRLAMPCGLVGLALIVNVLVAWAARQRTWAGAALAIAILYWITSNTYSGEAAIAYLERGHSPVDPRTLAPFDAVIVLGGGTMSDAQQRVWLGSMGDRVMLAARLYHQGKTRRLVTTGLVQTWHRSRAVDLSDATERIWLELGVPAAAIAKVGGLNTSQELRNVRQLLGDAPAGRIGLLTSAFHLPRAMRLARQNGVDVIPIPAGFLTPADEPPPLALIPNAHGANLLNVAAKEYLAAVLRR
jgi:uncharacterized SAM-binding protein YcdF (DUF218 family)